MVDTSSCPCGSGDTYDECCGRYHGGQAQAPTAVSLMRSRYTAFVRGDVEYLERTWHTSTRPRSLVLDDRLTWIRLDILATEAGGLFDDTGRVEFRAYHRVARRRGALHERSTFTRVGGRWFYVEGEVYPDGGIRPGAAPPVPGHPIRSR